MTETTRRRAVLYARKSSKEEIAEDASASKSVEDQIHAMREYVAAHPHVAVVGEPLYDDAISGRGETTRPGFMRVKAMIDAGEVDTLIVDTKSRMYRNSALREAFMQELDERGVHVHAVSQGGRIRRETAHGWFVDALDGLMDDRLWRERSEGWRKAHASNVRNGLPSGARVPRGYVRDGKQGAKDRRVVVDPERAAEIVRMFEMYADGLAINQIARWTSDTRGVFVPPANVKRTMRNQFYVGKVRFQGEWHPGAHEAIVTPELWQRVQRRLQRDQGTRIVRDEPRSFIMPLVKCGHCEGSVSVANGTGLQCTNVRRKVNGVSRCEGFGAPSIKRIEASVIYMLVAATVDSPHYDGPVAMDVVTRKRLEGRLVRLERSLAAAEGSSTRLALKYAKGGLSEAQFDAANDALNVETEGLRKQIAEVEAEIPLAPVDDEERRARLLTVSEVLVDLPPSQGAAALARDYKMIALFRPSGERKPFQTWKGRIELVPHGAYTNDH